MYYKYSLSEREVTLVKETSRAENMMVDFLSFNGRLL